MYNTVAIILLDREWCGRKGVERKDKKKEGVRLVTRKPNRPQNSGKEIDCVKKRY